jgi:hypothetical protein
MGKRRSDMPHKDRYAGSDDSDDDNVIEEAQSVRFFNFIVSIELE